MDDSGKVLDFVRIREKKTRKQKVFRLNKAARKAVEEYGEHYGCTPGRYLFVSRKGDNRPISRVQAWEVLNNAALQWEPEKILARTLRKKPSVSAFTVFQFVDGLKSSIIRP